MQIWSRAASCTTLQRIAITRSSRRGFLRARFAELARSRPPQPPAAETADSRLVFGSAVSHRKGHVWVRTWSLSRVPSRVLRGSSTHTTQQRRLAHARRHAQNTRACRCARHVRLPLLARLRLSSHMWACTHAHGRVMRQCGCKTPAGVSVWCTSTFGMGLRTDVTAVSKTTNPLDSSIHLFLRPHAAAHMHTMPLRPNPDGRFRLS